MPETKLPKLSPTRATMLRLVRYSEVEISYNGAAERSYKDKVQGWLTGHEQNALDWLTQNGFIRCIGQPNGLGMREGLVRPTAKGEVYLDQHRVLG